jgi:hypothetical protein
VKKMAKKLLIGAAIFGLSVLLIAMLVPTITAELGSEKACDSVGEHKGFGPKDDDEDGIPNGQDADYVPNENCTEDGPHGEMKQSKGTEQGSSGQGSGNEDGTGNMNKYKGENTEKGSGDKTQAKDQSCLE